MKILYVTTISNTVNAFLIPHIKFLLDEGNEVGLAFNKVQDVNPDLIKMGCKVHQVEFQRSPLKKENLFAYKKIKKIIVEEGYELIHVHTPVASFLTRLACRNIKNLKVLYTAHGFHFFKGAPLKNWAIYCPLEAIAAKWTDGLITINDEDYKFAAKLKLRKGGSVYKIHGVGLDFERFSPQTTENKNELRKEYGYQMKDFILMIVGELRYIKHQDLLIETVNKLKQKIPDIKLLLVGGGNLLNEYKNLANSLGVEKNVEFLGFRNDVYHLMKMSDIAISSSRREGLPVNVMEAMATGLPLVVTDCRGNRDLVERGKNGFIVGVDDIEACVLAIEKLYHSIDLRREFGTMNKEMIQLYSKDYVIGELKEIYSNLSFPKSIMGRNIKVYSNEVKRLNESN